jgi:hypothetical protein
LELGNPIYGSDYFDRGNLQWHAEEISKAKGIFQLTIQPYDIENMSQNAMNELAAYCRRINIAMSVPILLRYGHEMNGAWARYGMKPTAYKQSFIAMTNTVRRQTNMTAMLWAPNTGRGYPYGASFTTLNPTPADRAALDTNNDGVLDSKDDPYGPFYPGDEYVDWVGISAYWYKSPQVPTSRYFQLSLLDQQPNEDASYMDPTGSRKFYQRFAAAKDKPMAVGYFVLKNFEICDTDQIMTGKRESQQRQVTQSRQLV